MQKFENATVRLDVVIYRLRSEINIHRHSNRKRKNNMMARYNIKKIEHGWLPWYKKKKKSCDVLKIQCMRVRLQEQGHSFIFPIRLVESMYRKKFGMIWQCRPKMDLVNWAKKMKLKACVPKTSAARNRCVLAPRFEKA